MTLPPEALLLQLVNHQLNPKKLHRQNKKHSAQKQNGKKFRPAQHITNQLQQYQLKTLPNEHLRQGSNLDSGT